MLNIIRSTIWISHFDYLRRRHRQNMQVQQWKAEAKRDPLLTKMFIRAHYFTVTRLEKWLKRSTVYWPCANPGYPCTPLKKRHPHHLEGPNLLPQQPKATQNSDILWSSARNCSRPAARFGRFLGMGGSMTNQVFDKRPSERRKQNHRDFLSTYDIIYIYEYMTYNL